ncbi:MAG: hypothetical protein LUQ55_01050 [Methanomassiliicoccales archaeon]|nr:hypothetical protein [Methanomassiliicoccales archaeon]
MEPILLVPGGIELAVVAVMVVFGLALALAGHRIWKGLMGIIGAFLGFILGYTLGMVFSGELAGFLLGVIGAVFLGTVFYRLVSTGVAIVIAAAAFILLYQLGAGILISVLVAGAVFAIVFLGFERLIALFTALTGASMVVWGLDFLDVPAHFIVPAFLAVAAVGTVVQFLDIERKKKTPVVTHATIMKIDVVKHCPSCGQVLTFVPDYDAWFCYSCGRYS